jgi:hypothetical protein
LKLDLIQYWVHPYKQPAKVPRIWISKGIGRIQQIPRFRAEKVFLRETMTYFGISNQ